MLRQLSRLEKTRNFVLLAFVVLMAVSLIFFYAPSSGVQSTLARSQETVATVGGDYITVGDVATQQENLKRRYSQFGSSGFTPPAKTVLDDEINTRLVRQEAARMNLTPTDEEVATEIRRQLKAGGAKPDDIKNYEQIVTENYGSVARFEQSIRDQLAEEKLRAFLTSGVSVSEDEVLEQFRRQNTTFDLVYVPVGVPQVAEKLNPSEAELRNYFEQNKSRYYISSPQKKIRYLFINQAKVGEKLDIPEADLRAEYDALAPDKKQKGVNAQQIVLRVPDGNPAAEAKVQEKAASLVAEARKNEGKISEEDFAKIAQGNSEDPATARAGGRINGLVRENKNKPDDPLQKILALEPGQVTDPIKYNNNYYILRRGEAVPKSFEDAKQEILVSLRNRRAYKTAADLTAEAAARLKETQDVRRVAEEFAARTNMKPEEMVRETGFVKPGDNVENVGVSPQFEEGIAPLEAANQVGERTQIKDGFAVPQLVEKREPRDAEFDEVKDQVLAAFKIDNAKNQIVKIADDLAKDASSVDSLKAAAEKAGLKTAEAKSYRLGSPLGEGASASTSAALDDAIYNLKPGETAKNAINAGEVWYVVGLAKRNDASVDEFAKQRDQLIQAAAATKKGQIFNDYAANLKQRLEKEGRIKIYKDALAKLETAAATDEPS
jgi:peptidyl-prolyl cis-trans isomerase D